MRLSIASILGILGASLLGFYRYRSLWMSLLFFVILLCNFIIVLGLVSVMHLTVGFAEIAGIFFVLGMCTSQLLVITDEMIGGALTEEKMSIGWRAPKALSLVYTTTTFALVTTLMMIALGTSAIWSFLLIFLTGSFLTTFLSKPIYARALDYIYSRRARPGAPAR
jgi:preprotein translocase subunit SecF